MANKKPIVDVAGKLKELQTADHLLLQSGIELPITATPATPSAGIVLVYAKADKNVYQLDSLGVESILPGGGGGSSGYTVITVNSTPYSVVPTSGEYIYLIDATAASVTINLPTAVGNTAKYTFKKIDSSINIVTVDANGSQLIDIDLIQDILFENTSFTIISNNAQWYIIS